MWESEAQGWHLVDMWVGARVQEQSCPSSQSPLGVSLPNFVFGAITWVA